MKIIYEAFDGTQFNSFRLCEKYEMDQYVNFMKLKPFTSNNTYKFAGYLYPENADWNKLEEHFEKLKKQDQKM